MCQNLAVQSSLLEPERFELKHVKKTYRFHEFRVKIVAELCDSGGNLVEVNRFLPTI